MRFEPGAPPPPGTIPLSVPALAGNEERYIAECVRNQWLAAAGPFVGRFEDGLRDFLGGGHVVATASGTAALHLALLVSGVRPGELVLLPALSFIAPANAVRYVGAGCVFVDVEPDSGQLDPNRVREFLEKKCERTRDGGARHRESGRRIRAVLAVHVLGRPADMDPLAELAAEYDLVVVEDAAEALGATHRGRPAGRLGRVAALSFNGNKVITAAGGGALVTDDAAWADRARSLATQAKTDPVEYIHGEVGYNYRLGNLQAALGLAQLERLPDFLEKKRRIAERYRAGLENLPGIVLFGESEIARSSFWLSTILVDASKAGIDSRELLRRLEGQGIQTRPVWQPLSRSPAHAGAISEPTPHAEQIHARALSLPSSVGLTETDQDRVIDAVRRCVASRA